LPVVFPQAAAAQAPERIAVATFSILGNLLESIVDRLWKVHSLVGHDADAHSYQPIPRDARRLARADLLVSNGLGFERWLDRLISAAPFKGRHVVATTGITPMTRADTPGTAPIADPHCWQDVGLVRRYVSTIAEAIGEADAVHADAYRERAKDLDRRLAALDAWIRNEIGRVPPQKRSAITSHDAFGYFARAYGVELLAVRGINPDHEPTADDIRRLIALVRKHKVRALFVEPLGNASFINQIAHDAEAVVGAPLYSDALSPPDGPAASYEALMRYNVSAFVEGMLHN
jgi:zinc/manganese transport system substrate-binding protein